ncbi:MAG: hypothetical protein H6712_14525 [Myxococcales bacterium]|nr:hypothetical protein [Myxococcales bacterium]
MAWVLWSHSRPADLEGMRVCALPIAKIEELTGFNRRRAYDQIAVLLHAGWIVRGKLPKPARGRAKPVLVLRPWPLSPIAAGERKAAGRMEIDFGSATSEGRRRTTGDLGYDGAFARARARRNAGVRPTPKPRVGRCEK